MLRNPVPVKALYDRDAAHEVTLRNLLQRRGYENLDAVRAEGEIAGVAHSILTLLGARGLKADPADEARILDCRDPEVLRRWLVRTASIDALGDLFAEE